MSTATIASEGLERLSKDLRLAAKTMTVDEARFLVDSYYTAQDHRIRTAGQIRQMTESGEPHEVLKWSNAQAEQWEADIQKALDAYSNSFVLGQWARSQYGIGPVIAAGLLAHIDITKAKGCGAIWRFAGLDPTSVWGKGEKRPWNGALKVLCWKIGESFVKTSGREGDVYGHLLIEKKEQMTALNEAGHNAAAAAEVLARVPTHKQKDIYATGRLPPGHIFSRAKRWAVKLFLAHYFEVAFELKFNCPAPKPYILTLEGGHTHKITVPNWPMEEKLPSDLRPIP